MVAENEFDKEGLDKAEPDKPDDDKVFNIQIDRVVYQVSETRMTGGRSPSCTESAYPG